METIILQHLPDARYVTDPFITTDEWLKILKETERQGHLIQIDTLMMFFRMPLHKSTCVEIGKEYSMKMSAVNILVTHFCKFAQKQLGNRFRVEEANSSKDTLWPIIMLGKELKNNRFEWQLRPELVAAIREYLLDKLLEKYRERILEGGLDNKYSEELYKWKILAECKDKTDIDILNIMSDPSNQMNLITWRSKSSLRKMITAHPEETVECFSILKDESRSFADKLQDFKKESDKLVTGDIINHIHNDRVAALYLACLDPVKNSLYKYELYETFCKYLGYNVKGDADNYDHYVQLIQPIIEREKADKELTAKLHKETDAYFWSDLLNAQDVLWQMQDFMKSFISKNWLQRFYDAELDAKESPYTGWFLYYEKNVKEVAVMMDADDVSTNPDKDALELLLKKSDNGVSNIGSGMFNADEYQKILDLWPEIYKVLFNAMQNNMVTPEDFQALEDILHPALTREHPQAIRRIWCTLFPELLSSVTNSPILYKVFDKIRSCDDSLSKPTWDWLEDNKTLMKYFDAKVKFTKPWHRALLAMDIYWNLDVNENNPNMEKYIKLLESNYNLVLTGAPGTGKTYLAKEIAKQITGGDESHIKLVQFHPSYDYTDFVEGLRPDADTGGFIREDGVFKKFCAMALSSVQTDNFDEAYERLATDLVENYGKDNPLVLTSSGGAKFGISLNNNRSLNLHTGKDLQINGSLTKDNLAAQLGGGNVYKWWVGYFKGVENLLISNYGLTLNDKAEGGKYVFIIDEINRGELSKIFGELFFSIDPGYRGEKGRVDTQYQNLVEKGDPFYEGFYVPENVYIIGTMNDIDRSVESMDFAVRRRFAWYEVKATERVSMLDEKIPEQAETAKKSMNALNVAIRDPKIGLSSAYEIGPAYYLKLEKYDDDFESLWTFHIRCLLLEYLRGTKDAEEKVDILLKKAFYSYKD